MPRCKRPVTPNAFCGLPAGNHWPHRYIERNLVDRIKHEVNLRRYGYTTTWEMLKAIGGRA